MSMGILVAYVSVHHMNAWCMPGALGEMLWISPREDHSCTGLSQKNVFISPPVTVLGVGSSSVVLSPFQGEVLSTWVVDVLQMSKTARIGTTEAKKQG